MARPSLTVTSSASAPARGTIRTDRTSPATRAGCRGSTWSIGVVWSRSQKAVSSWRSSSSTGFVSFSTNFRSATILSRSAGSQVTASRPGTLVADACPLPSFRASPSRSSCAARHRRVLGQRFAPRPPKSKATTTTTTKAATVLLTGGEAVVASAGGDVPLDDATKQAVLDASQQYVDAAVLAPLDEAARVGNDYAALFDAGRARGRDRRRPRRAHRRGDHARHHFADGDRDTGALRRSRRPERRGAARRDDVQRSTSAAPPAPDRSRSTARTS